MALGALESDVMRVLWTGDTPLTVREVLVRLNAARGGEPLAYTTVMTVLVRLAAKGAVERTRRGRGFVYAPLTTDEAGIAVADVLRRYGGAAVAHFLAAVETADPDARRRLRRLLDEQDGGA
ncbi:BlaI/MecI/CopY family transcriptional regulator [Mangrovactinospora gilvigrisea]|uniref:BlaI/MecI/CopY family transcriptional regulator n=1 Tax=Mangrovactinospora gilvigrisea TaxID=1428644 RepID=UPI001FE82AED|nr:BlaI/MecI/CopY family transcriptional regulator [Mangrovactinospora gilvigrisea]